MRKFLSGIMCLTIILLSMPGLALAETTPKQEFISSYLTYVDHSLDMQEAMMQGLQTNTIKFALDAELSDGKLTLEDGTNITNIPGRVTFSLAFNPVDLQALLDFNINVPQYSMNGQAYFTKDGLIVPRETIRSLAEAGVDIGDLGDIEKLPPYIVFDTGMSEREFSNFQQAWKESIGMQTQQLQTVRTLIETLLNILPDNCFYYSETKPVMDLTRVSFVDLVGSLKEHRESLAEQFTATISRPAGMNDKEFAAMKEQIKADIIEGINSLNAADISKSMQEFPISLQACKFTAGSDSLESVVKASCALPDGTSFVFSSSSTDTMKGTKVATIAALSMTLKSSPFNMEMNLDSTGTANLNRADFTIVFSGRGKDTNNSLRGKIKMNGAFNWSSQGSIQIPQLTYYNSKRVNLHTNTNRSSSVKIFIDGEEVFFAHTQPLIKNGVTMVPIRALSDALDCELDWQEPGTLVLRNGSGRDLVMNMGSTSYQIGDEEFFMDEAPFISNGCVLVPVRVVSEYCDLSVEWDAVSRTIKIHRLQP